MELEWAIALAHLVGPIQAEATNKHEDKVEKPE